MIYQKAAKHLLTQAFKDNRFKGMDKWLQVVIKIGLIPLYILTFFSLAWYYVTLFFYRGITSPVEYLHRIIKDEAKDVKHATQFAIYWLAFPFVFFLYVLKSMASIMFYFLWFSLMLCVYLVTLGGVRFQPFLMDVTFEEENYDLIKKPGLVGTMVFTGILYFFYLLFLMGVIVVPQIMPIGQYGMLLMLLIVNPIVFRKKPVTNPFDSEDLI